MSFYKEIYVANPVFKKKEDVISDNKKLVEDMLSTGLVKAKTLPNGITSYNFTREAFFDNKFDSLNVKARGLFLYDNFEIAARSYDKFFNVLFGDPGQELDSDFQDSHIDRIESNLFYPVQVFKKENGYLGLLSWNFAVNDWLIASKSTTEKEFAENFRRLLEQKGWLNDKVKEYLRTHKETFIFEVIDVENDPHIIEYNESDVILLDVVRNNFNGEFYKYDEMRKIMSDIHPSGHIKELIALFNDFQALREFLFSMDGMDAVGFDSMEDYEKKNFIFQNYVNTPIEGFVCEDNKRYRFKFKTGFYRYWKSFRPHLQRLQMGKDIKTSKAFNAQLPVLRWLEQQPFEKIKNYSIIDLRNNYLKETME